MGELNELNHRYINKALTWRADRMSNRMKNQLSGKDAVDQGHMENLRKIKSKTFDEYILDDVQIIMSIIDEYMEFLITEARSMSAESDDYIHNMEDVDRCRITKSKLIERFNL